MHTKEEKEVIDRVFYLYQFFTIFSLISSTFSFGMKKCRMLSNVVPLVGQILRGSIAVVLRHHMYVVDAL